MRAMLAAMLLAGCHVQQRPTVDVTDEPGDLDGCAAACDNVQRMRCPDWKDSPEAPCDVVCRNAQSEGHSMNTDCVSRAGSCAEAQTCFEEEP